MAGSTKQNAKTESVELRVSESEKRAFREAADIAGLPMSAWMRERLRRAAAKELESQGRQIPFYQQLTESPNVEPEL